MSTIVCYCYGSLIFNSSFCCSNLISAPFAYLNVLNYGVAFFFLMLIMRSILTGNKGLNVISFQCFSCCYYGCMFFLNVFFLGSMAFVAPLLQILTVENCVCYCCLPTRLFSTSLPFCSGETIPFVS